jgi:hypothetical protein
VNLVSCVRCSGEWCKPDIAVKETPADCPRRLATEALAQADDIRGGDEDVERLLEIARSVEMDGHRVRVLGARRTVSGKSCACPGHLLPCVTAARPISETEPLPTAWARLRVSRAQAYTAGSRPSRRASREVATRPPRLSTRRPGGLQTGRVHLRDHGPRHSPPPETAGLDPGAGRGKGVCEAKEGHRPLS